MKKYFVIFILSLSVAAVTFYLNDKSSQQSCIRNLDKYKVALEVILENKKAIVNRNKVPESIWVTQIISRESIEELRKGNPEFQNILYLWDKGLISKDYGIMINNHWQSIDFDLRGEGRCLSYLPSDNFTFTCAGGQIEPHMRIEKDWYYVHYCPE